MYAKYVYTGIFVLIENYLIGFYGFFMTFRMRIGYFLTDGKT